jgi:5'-nucleotidase/UDP-sugar diphosphatase
MSGKKIVIGFFSVLLSLALFLAPTALAGSGQAKIRIFFMSDFHGFAEPYRPFGSINLEGGIAYLASRLKQLRQKRPSLLLAAGDMIQGDNWANLFQGASVIELMNAMGFDAMVVGNHEFDFGQEVLKKRIAEANFPVLGANVEGFPSLKPFIIKEVGGVKIAIIGIITPETAASTHPKNIVGLTFLPPEPIVKKYLAELKTQVDLVLVLSHQGYQADLELAQRVPGIDLIVGGHSHTRLNQPIKVDGTIIVQDYEHARTLGVLDLTVEDGKVTSYGGGLEAIDPISLPADPVILEIVKKYGRKVDAALNVPVGEAAVALDGSHVRSRETNLGNLVAESSVKQPRPTHPSSTGEHQNRPCQGGDHPEKRIGAAGLGAFLSFNGFFLVFYLPFFH